MDSWVPFGRLRDREIICSISTLGAVVGVGVDITNQQIPSMYGIVNYIWLFLRENVLVYIYTIHGWFGYGKRFSVEV